MVGLPADLVAELRAEAVPCRPTPPSQIPWTAQEILQHRADALAADAEWLACQREAGLRSSAQRRLRAVS